MSQYVFRKGPQKVIISTTKKYYVYILRYPDGYISPQGENLSSIIFYVGKGTGRRVLEHFQAAGYGYVGRTYEVIRKVWKAGKQVEVDILLESDDEEEALQQEQYYIRKFSTPCLVNYAFNRGNKTPCHKYTLSDASLNQLLEIAHQRGVRADIALSQVIEEAYQKAATLLNGI